MFWLQREEGALRVPPAWFFVLSLLSSRACPGAAHRCTGWAMNCAPGEVALPSYRLNRTQKVMTTSVRSQRLLFQLDVFSGRLRLEVRSKGRTPPHRGLATSCWGFPAPPRGWTGAPVAALQLGSPWGPGPLVEQENYVV